jgi:hypothetical protein
MSGNIYALEPLLLAHLRASCPSVQIIAGISDALALKSASQIVNQRPNPVVDSTGAGSARYGGAFVYPRADFFGIAQAGSSSEGGCAIKMQGWMILVATRNQVRLDQVNNNEPCASRQDNGLLCPEVIAAMEAFRWTPATWPGAPARLRLQEVPTGLPASVFPDANGLYVTAFCFETEAVE